MKKLFMLTAFILLSGCQPKESPLYEGVIQGKYFQSGQSATGMSIGGSAVFLDTSDEYTIFVNNEHYELPKESWLQLNEGDTIRYKVDLGTIHDIQLLK